MAATVVLFALVAGAQEAPKKRGFRIGPLQISAVAPFAAGVDSNVYNTPSGIADRSFTISPTLDILLPLGRRARIKTIGGVAPYYFAKEEAQRHTDAFVRTRLEVDAGPLTLFGGIARARYRQRFSLEIDERIRRDESGHLYGVAVRLRRRATLTASQDTLTSTFDPDAIVAGQPVSTALDRETRTRRIELSVPLTLKTSLKPWADIIDDRFLHATAGLPPHVGSQRYAAALEFSELAFLKGRFAAGIRHFDAGQEVPPYTGPYVSITLGIPFVKGTRFQLAAIRDVNYSAVAPTDTGFRQTFVASTFGTTFIFELPLQLQGRAFGGYEAADYLQPASSALEPRRDYAWTGGGALLRHLGEHLSLGGIAQYQHRTSTLETQNYRKTLFGVTGDLRF